MSELSKLAAEICCIFTLAFSIVNLNELHYIDYNFDKNTWITILVLSVLGVILGFGGLIGV